MAEINGEVQMGKIKRGNREIIVKSKTGDEKHYLVPLSKQILVQENDYVRAGMPLSDGAVSPSDILNILGPIKVQEYIVNEVQAVYRMQGVKINDKHFEIIVRQMMRKVQIVDPGDTHFLPEQLDICGGEGLGRNGRAACAWNTRNFRRVRQGGLLKKNELHFPCVHYDQLSV